MHVSASPHYIYSLSQAYSQLDDAFKAMGNEDYVLRGVCHREAGRQGTALSNFFGTFMPAERPLLMNSPNLVLCIQIETADGMDNWEARVPARWSVMIKKHLLQSYGVKLLAILPTQEP